jgi:hypothetical protein
MIDHTWARQAPIDEFLALLAAGWRLPWIVQPIGGYVDGTERPAVNHGAYAMLLERDDAPNTGLAMGPVSPGPSLRACAPRRRVVASLNSAGGASALPAAFSGEGA